MPYRWIAHQFTKGEMKAIITFVMVIIIFALCIYAFRGSDFCLVTMEYKFFCISSVADHLKELR